MVTVRTIDETTLGAMIDGPSIDLPSSTLTVADLIRLRVRAEVDRYNQDRPERFYGLVQPGDIESMLNGPTNRPFKPIDPDLQIAVALDAFERQSYIILLPAGQARSLDQTISLYPDDSVSFLRLVPLIGG